MRFKLFIMGAGLLLILGVFQGVAHAATFTVNSTGDASDTNLADGVCKTAAGTCTLRAAIQQANKLAGTDTINFNIPRTDPGCNASTGVCTIKPASPLPGISSPVIINGYTQPGASEDPNPTSLPINAVLKIELDGSNAGSKSGLELSASSNTVKGLVINRFPLCGIEIPPIKEYAGNKVVGNFIGTDSTGTQDLGNVGCGVVIGSHTNLVEGNVISGNDNAGVQISGSGAFNNTVRGNVIGTDVKGTIALGNGLAGVWVTNGASYNTISANVIAYNGSKGGTRSGVEVHGKTSIGNAILANSIFSNNRLGIDLAPPAEVTPNDPFTGDADTGPNTLQNFPVLGPQVILSSTPNAKVRIEFFSNPSCDSSGHGEGQTFLGSKTVTTDAQGNVSTDYPFTISSLPAGSYITATATINNNTSEFSKCLQVTASIAPPPPPPSKCGDTTATSSPPSVTYTPPKTLIDITVTIFNKSPWPRTLTAITKQGDKPFTIVSIDPSLPQYIEKGLTVNFKVKTQGPWPPSRVKRPVTVKAPYFDITLDCGTLTTAAVMPLPEIGGGGDFPGAGGDGNTGVQPTPYNFATLRLSGAADATC